MIPEKTISLQLSFILLLSAFLPFFGFFLPASFFLKFHYFLESAGRKKPKKGRKADSKRTKAGRKKPKKGRKADSKRTKANKKRKNQSRKDREGR